MVGSIATFVVSLGSDGLILSQRSILDMVVKNSALEAEISHKKEIEEKAAVFTLGALRASESLHRQLVETILSATFRWLDKTPTSRIITRVTKDVSAAIQ
ncbi:hypothetical protein H2248_012607 [Termitomyces sp. 'cryptogamus']|nr:hypothetical protein H2248_012607 [Termitomyces sp. 'cryptogamus']